MNAKPKASEQRNDLSLLHEKMISLLNDSGSFQQFSKSPQGYASQFVDLPAQYRNLLASVNLAGLTTFRRIVRGTREIRFRQVFSNLHGKMQSEVNWFDLVEKFLDSVAIKNGRDDVDLTLFAMYVRSNECPLFGDLATLERSIYSVSNCYMDFTGIDQKFEIANDLDLLPWVEVVMTTYRAATLLSPEPASTLTRSPDTLYTLIYKSKLDNDVRLRPITPDLGKLLSQSRRLQGELLTANNLIMNEVRHLWAEGCFQASKFGGDGQ